MTLLKTSMLNGIAVSVRMIVAILLNKVLAVYVGPSGYAFIGQFQNVIAIFTNIAGGATKTGVTKYTAQYFDDDKKQYEIWRSAALIAVILSFFVSVFIFVFYKDLAVWVWHKEEFGTVFLWFAFTVPFFAFNTLLLAVLNGRKEVLKYVTINIIGNVIALVVAGLAAKYGGLFGALVALATNQCIVFFVSIWFFKKLPWFSWKKIWGAFDAESTAKLGKFALMALLSALLIPIVQISIRSYLVSNIGVEEAGYWQGVVKVSDMYLMFITMTLSLYYLPRISEIKSAKEMRREVFYVYRWIMPLVILSSLIIYVLRPWIIEILFSPEFSPMGELFFWQFAGDVVKIASWVLSFIMVGRALTRLYIITEVFFAILWVALVMLISTYLGLQGSVIAYFFSYVVYFCIMVAIFTRYLKNESNFCN